MNQRSQSAEPVIIEAAEGAEPRPPYPDARSTISQIRLQKNTVHSGICVNCGDGYLSLSALCGEAFFLLFALCVQEKFAYFRAKRVIDLHINRAGLMRSVVLSDVRVEFFLKRV